MSREPPKPVYVLHGQDQYLRRHHLDRILNDILGEDRSELAVARLDEATELVDVLDELRTAAFLAPRRVVIIRDADKFVTRYRNQLEQYLENPSAAGSLVLVANDLKGNSRLIRMASKVGLVVNCSHPAESQLPRWIDQSFRARGKTVARDAARLLAAWIGPDLARLDEEIEKLALYVGDRKGVSADDMAAVVAATAGPVAFALTNAIAAGDSRKALEALDDLLTGRGKEFAVMGSIGWYLRSSLEGKPMRGRPARSRPEATKIFQEFRHAIRADLAMKSGATPLATMQMLVMALCR